jgi:hypothetical protein
VRLCDGAEVLLLVASVELGSGNLDPGGVCGGDAEGVHSDGGEFVNGRGVEEGGIASLKSRATLVTKVAAESPLIRSTGVERVEPFGVVGLLLGQPTAEVGAVGLVGLPVDVVATVDALGPVDRGAVSDAASYFLDDVEWALIMVLGDLTVAASGVGVQDDAKLLQEVVQVCGSVADDSSKDLVRSVEDVTDETGGRSCCGRRGQQGSGDGDVRTHG